MPIAFGSPQKPSPSQLPCDGGGLLDDAEPGRHPTKTFEHGQRPRTPGERLWKTSIRAVAVGGARAPTMPAPASLGAAAQSTTARALRRSVAGVPRPIQEMYLGMNHTAGELPALSVSTGALRLISARLRHDGASDGLEGQAERHLGFAGLRTVCGHLLPGKTEAGLARLTGRALGELADLSNFGLVWRERLDGQVAGSADGDAATDRTPALLAGDAREGADRGGGRGGRADLRDRCVIHHVEQPQLFGARSGCWGSSPPGAVPLAMCPRKSKRQQRQRESIPEGLAPREPKRRR